MSLLRRLALPGQAIGVGTTRGRARRLDQGRSGASHRHLSTLDLAPEIQRLDRAIHSVAEELQAAANHLAEHLGLTRDAGEVLHAHVALVKDPELRGRVVSLIRAQSINASWAVEQALSQVAQEFQDTGDPYLAERRIDVLQTCQRLVARLEQRSSPPVETLADEGEIIVADDLGPHAALELLEHGIAGVVVQSGSPTSHLALLCRAFNRPALMGVDGALDLLADGDDLLMDLDRALLLRNPAPEDLRAQRPPAPPTDELPQLASTSCGQRIQLLANVDVRQALDLAEAQGAEGVGLFRSEFLWKDGREPSEDLQRETYRLIRDRMGRVTVRTFDLGSDKMPGHGRTEPNPALGLRALRRYRREPDVFDRQVRCLLDVADREDNSLGILLPMVDGLDNFNWACARIEDHAQTMGRSRGIHFRLGAMIELPAALFALNPLADAADFFCLGTNDLVQYLLAVDRENPELSTAADPRHPSVLAAIEQVYRACKSAGIDCTCCGDLAATDAGCLFLLGLGGRQLSLPPGELQSMVRFLKHLSLKQAEQITQKALSFTTQEQVQDYVDEMLGELRAQTAMGFSSKGSNGASAQRDSIS